MNRLFSFLAGAMCGALVGATAVLLTTPASGSQLRTDAINRWGEAVKEAQLAMAETRQALETEFEQMKSGPTN